MERPSYKLLPCTGFSQNEDRRVRWRHRLDLTERSLENAALPDYFFKIVLGADLFLKVKSLLFQPVLRFAQLTMFESVVDGDGHLARHLCKKLAIIWSKGNFSLSAKAQDPENPITSDERHNADELKAFGGG